MNIYIYTGRLKEWFKKGARSLLVGYAMLFIVTMWTAEDLYNSQVSFFNECHATGGFITYPDGGIACTRLRSGGMMQL